MANLEAVADSIKEFTKRWWSVIGYTISIALYYLDLGSDFILGTDMIYAADRGQMVAGVTILALILFPTLVVFSIVFFKRLLLRITNKNSLSSDYEFTLLGIDWLHEDDVLQWKAWLGRVLIVLRIDIFMSYLELVMVQCRRKDSDAWRKIERKRELKLRGEMFLEACFEALPQCIIQLYLFGTRSTVSNLQVISFSLSIFSLCYTFMYSQVKREVEIYYKPITEEREETSVTAGETDDMIPVDANSTRAVATQAIVKRLGKSTQFEIKEGTKSFSLRTKLIDDDQDPFPRSITLSLQLKRITVEEGNTEQDDGKKATYTLKNTRIKSKTKTYEKLFYFCIRLLNIAIGSPTFFFTAFPAVSLFSALFGKRFMLFYLPIICHFIAEYWWWRPKMMKRNINASFYSLYLAFKLLLRIITLGWLCVWFIKVVSYYPSMKPFIFPSSHRNASSSANTSLNTPPFEMPSAVTRLVWNEHHRAHRFLSSIAKYNRDRRTYDWEKECRQMRANSTDNAGLSGKSNCAIDVAKYIFCITFYMNIIGMVWEFLNYILFMTFHVVNRAQKWIGSTNSVDGQDGSAHRNRAISEVGNGESDIWLTDQV